MNCLVLHFGIRVYLNPQNLEICRETQLNISDPSTTMVRSVSFHQLGARLDRVLQGLIKDDQQKSLKVKYLYQHKYT